MKKSIEISIECKGKAVGTLGWVNSILKESELVVKNCKNGTPGMFLKAKRLDGTGVDYYFIAKKVNEYQDGYRDAGNGFVCVYAESDNQYRCGFSDYPLTPAAKLVVEEMIKKATAAFMEWWEEN